jgi:hypothetical protein
MTTDYNKQANDFLNATSTAFTATYKEHSTYFDDDKTTRDIYTIVLKNKQHRYRFLFGQSVSESNYGGKPPSAYDVLSCLTKYDIGSFEDFCGEFGYDLDSRKAYKTYKAVLKEWKNVERLFSSEQIELLQEIQ